MEKHEFKAQAYLSISNTGGIEIMVSNETVYYRYSYGNDDEEILESNLEYDGEDCRPYFKHTDGEVYWIDEFMRY